MSTRPRWLLTLGAALMLAAPLSAQPSPAENVALWPVAPTAPVAATSTVATTDVLLLAARDNAVLGLLLMPAGESAILGLPVLPVAAPSMAPVQSGGNQGRNVAMMVVGGAALVVGSLIDGDTGTIVMVSGGVIGLIGLYRYLR